MQKYYLQIPQFDNNNLNLNAETFSLKHIVMFNYSVTYISCESITKGRFKQLQASKHIDKNALKFIF
jgi:hypothetical protein